MRLIAVAAFVLVATPAFADAVTYRGDLNTIPVVVEFSEPPESAGPGLFARYFYVTEGIDIPLLSGKAEGGGIALNEEAPCEPEECEIDQSGLIIERLPTAIWTLEVSDGGASIAGTWGSKGAKQLPVRLERTGTRPFTPSDPPAVADLAEFSLYVLGGDSVLSRETSPYDFLKVTVPLAHSKETRWGNVAFDYVTDPRTLFQYPRVKDLGGTDTSPANDFLSQRDWGMRLAALNCRSQIYPAMAMGGYVPPDGGSLGGFDEEQVEVHYLSPRLLSFTESGSLWCGGAYPENHSHAFNIDIVTGQPVDLTHILKGWVARDYGTGGLVDLKTARADPHSYQWGADETLAAFVMDHSALLKSDQIDEECSYPELVRDNLAISVRMPDTLVFGLDGLPHVIQACADELYAAPISELKDLLAPEVESYFPGALD